MDLIYTNCQDSAWLRLLFMLHIVTDTSKKLQRIMFMLIIGANSRDRIFEIQSFAHLIGLWIKNNRIIKYMLHDNNNFPKKNLKYTLGSGLS